jgi:hypothetical protein
LGCTCVVAAAPLLLPHMHRCALQRHCAPSVGCPLAKRLSWGSRCVVALCLQWQALCSVVVNIKMLPHCHLLWMASHCSMTGHPTVLVHQMASCLHFGHSSSCTSGSSLPSLVPDHLQHHVACCGALQHSQLRGAGKTAGMLSAADGALNSLHNTLPLRAGGWVPASQERHEEA